MEVKRQRERERDREREGESGERERERGREKGREGERAEYLVTTICDESRHWYYGLSPILASVGNSG